jgi:hypothetical protein
MFLKALEGNPRRPLRSAEARRYLDSRPRPRLGRRARLPRRRPHRSRSRRLPLLRRLRLRRRQAPSRRRPERLRRPHLPARPRRLVRRRLPRPPRVLPPRPHLRRQPRRPHRSPLPRRPFASRLASRRLPRIGKTKTRRPRCLIAPAENPQRARCLAACNGMKAPRARVRGLRKPRLHPRRVQQSS